MRFEEIDEDERKALDKEPVSIYWKHNDISFKRAMNALKGLTVGSDMDYVRSVILDWDTEISHKTGLNCKGDSSLNP